MMISLKLDKKDKAALKANEAPLASNQPEYPYGTRLNFDSEQLAKLPGLGKAAVGEIITGQFKAKVVEMRVDERDGSKKRQSVELQITDIALQRNPKEDAAMPAGYEKMRDKFAKEFFRQGMSDGEAMKAAKTKAAKIWNSQHPKNPVGAHSDEGKK